jgi:hypothetical protein
MPGTGTLGKLFFNFFLNDLAGAGGAASALKTNSEMNKPRWKSGVYRLTFSGLAGHVASRQENNPAEMVATARKIRRAPAGQNRGGADWERVRSHLRNRA